MPKSANSCPYQCSKSDVIDAIKTTVDRIDGALRGDEYHPEGLIEQRTKDHKRIVRIERLLWTAGGAVTILLIVFKVFIS